MITVKILDETHKADINIPNEPFRLYGRMIPACADGKWTHTVTLLPEGEQTQMRFPDENYDYCAMQDEHVFIGAYDGDTCVGLAVMRHHFLKYMYLYDLKVSAAQRGRGVGKMLIEEAKKVALSHGYRGIYTHGQDNNLGACLFYLGSGFSIGGFDNRGYGGTSQEGKADITFYLDI